MPASSCPSSTATRAERADAARNRERILLRGRAPVRRARRRLRLDGRDRRAAGRRQGHPLPPLRLARRARRRRCSASASARFQEEIIRGEPPLGPGAPPPERLIAFGEARARPARRPRANCCWRPRTAARASPPRPTRSHRLHVTLLLREADPGCDAELLAETLLAASAPTCSCYLREVREHAARAAQGRLARARASAARAAPRPRASA